MRKDTAEKESEAVDETPLDTQSEGAESSGEFVPDTDFNLEDEYKPEPLVPGGNYRGGIIGVVFDAVQHVIVWKVCLADNGGVMSDGETSIDGSHHYSRNFVPKPGDENEMTKDGRQTKRQVKINMMTRFAELMKINMNTPRIIAESIANQDWVGISVIVTVSVGEYLGVTRNQIDRMIAAEG